MIKKNFFLLLTLTLILILSSCGRQDDHGNEVLGSSIIVGDLDWKEITTLSPSHPIRINSHAVADIDLPAMGSRCTGFMITEDILMTNQHCIPSSSYARGVTANFKHEQGVNKTDIESFDCSVFVGNDSALDFALLKCQGKPGLKFGIVTLTDSVSSVGSSIYVIQQNCDYYSKSDCDWTKKFSQGQITKLESEYTHNADTLGGSSGSPVFDSSTHKVVGLHHAGYGNNGMGRGYENYAVPMNKIVPVLKSKYGLFSGIGGSSGGSSLVEGGKSLATAKLIGAGEFKGELSKTGDVDFFKFTLKSSATVSISISFKHSAGDLDLALYAPNGKVIKVSDSTSDVEKVNQSLSAGEYIVKVYGYRGAQGAYQFSIK